MVTPTTVFERLTQHFQYRAVKFKKLVQEEHAIVGQRNFTGSRHGAASYQPDGRSAKECAKAPDFTLPLPALSWFALCWSALCWSAGLA